MQNIWNTKSFISMKFRKLNTTQDLVSQVQELLKYDATQKLK